MNAAWMAVVAEMVVEMPFVAVFAEWFESELEGVGYNGSVKGVVVVECAMAATKMSRRRLLAWAGLDEDH